MSRIVRGKISECHSQTVKFVRCFQPGRAQKNIQILKDALLRYFVIWRLRRQRRQFEMSGKMKSAALAQLALDADFTAHISHKGR